jgi:hypothetical protein
MPTTPCPKFLLFVEGTMERVFINSNYPKYTVIPVENGNSWTTSRLCDQIISKYKAKKIYPEAVIVWFDREENAHSSQEIAQSVRSSFEDVGYPSTKVHCLISDRMVENLILSDEVMMKEYLQDESYEYCGDGTHGKSKLKEIFKNLGREYKITTDGPKLLSKMRLSRSALKSHFASDFVTLFDYECPSL